jgi:Tol biopolymer transport system component
MLTDGGENAEAYFSFDGSALVFQSTRPPFGCDQIFTIPVAGGEPGLVSSGTGRTTCAHFLPGNEEIIYSSTHLGGADCPPTPDHSRGYVWPIYPSYDIFRASADGSGLVRLTDTPGYDAEATVSPQGDRITHRYAISTSTA